MSNLKELLEPTEATGSIRRPQTIRSYAIASEPSEAVEATARYEVRAAASKATTWRRFLERIRAYTANEEPNF